MLSGNGDRQNIFSQEGATNMGILRFPAGQREEKKSDAEI
ncbi:Uncharacterized protein dnm_086150 [Desulfonema magnum]|uniref:Uncharacterized protein n=1 Tax=Desulfonema magnum TaxID=45655 RepID=A0A975GT18_9BACT|nr:Uncharacterized protein dnm_086150 [Desulfonema magnum]